MPVRYIVAGAVGAGTLLGLLYILHDRLGLPVVTSSVIAFSLALVVSFVLQKFWAFQDQDTSRSHVQFAYFLTLALFNVGADAVFMHLLVDILGIWYILSQVLASGTIAIWSFFLYRSVVFRSS